MTNTETHDRELEERYRSMLQGYYELLQVERGKSPAHIAIEEVKLRLFLSLLDKPISDERDRDTFSASPL
jgi:hypothetical protein